MEERVKKFKSIFYGLDRAHGIYKSCGESVNGKAGGGSPFLVFRVLQVCIGRRCRPIKRPLIDLYSLGLQFYGPI